MIIRDFLKRIWLKLSPSYRVSKRIEAQVENLQNKIPFISDEIKSLETTINQKYEKNIQEYINSLNHCRHMYKRGRDEDIDNSIDYFRLSSLELMASKFKEEKTTGECAELGVFRGEFARLINKYFPDRILYLFDTFEGFDIRDTEFDDEKNYRKAIHDFSHTSVKSVLDKMPYPEKCIVKKGYFPESINDDILPEFCFVSIDVDLYKPIYSGLEFFYKKLVKGGVIFVHDYENCDYEGVKQAVKDFSKAYDISYFIMSDICGSAVFIK